MQNISKRLRFLLFFVLLDHILLQDFSLKLTRQGYLIELFWFMNLSILVWRGFESSSGNWYLEALHCLRQLAVTLAVWRIKKSIAAFILPLLPIKYLHVGIYSKSSSAYNICFFFQSEIAARKMMAGSAAAGFAAGGLAATLGTLTLGTVASEVGTIAIASAAASEVATAGGPAKSGPDAAASMGGSFFESLTSSDFYKNTKVYFQFDRLILNYHLTSYSTLSLSVRHLRLCTGWRHLRIIPLGTVSCLAEVRYIPNHALAAFQIPNEKPPCGWPGWRKNWKYHHTIFSCSHAGRVCWPSLVWKLGHEEALWIGTSCYEAW